MPRQAIAEATIIEGAMRAVARHGMNNLTINGIAAECGISRGTVYRYFKTRNDIIEAVGEYTWRRLVDDMTIAFSESSESDDRLRLVLGVFSRARREPAAQLFEAEPRFGINFVRREFPNMALLVREVLGSMLDDAPLVRDGLLTALELAEMFVRMAISVYIVPRNGGDTVPERTAVMWAGLFQDKSARPSAKPQSLGI